MEQLIIFLLFVIGSIISSIIQNKKKKAEEQQQRELEELTRHRGGEAPPAPAPPRRAETPWPQTAGDWQEQLRRILQGETPQPQPPPVIKPVLVPPVQKQPSRSPQSPPKSPQTPQPQPRLAPPPVVPVHTSASSYQRAAHLHAAVEDRMRAVTQQTSTHLPQAATQRPARGQSDFVRRLRRNPRVMREAFIASVIFGPAKSLEHQPTDVR